jgi:hypothetical protein
MLQKKIVTTLVGLLMFAAWGGLAHAQSDPTAVEFPMIGIGFDQTLQVNVVIHPPQPCTPTIIVYGQDGGVLVTFVQGDPDKPLLLRHLVSSFPKRVEVRPEVTLTPPPGVAPNACQALATAEVFDDFIMTDWVLTPGLVPPGPSNMPIYLGPAGLIAEQTARLNVVAHPPEPCFGTLSFIDAAGKPLGSMTPVSLMPGQATFLDLTGSQAGIAESRRRPEVIGVFTPSATTAPGICVPSLEVFDQFTGYTRVLVPPGPSNIPPGPQQ